jgi:hypothetical protein
MIFARLIHAFTVTASKKTFKAARAIDHEERRWIDRGLRFALLDCVATKRQRYASSMADIDVVFGRVISRLRAMDESKEKEQPTRPNG